MVWLCDEDGQDVGIDAVSAVDVSRAEDEGGHDHDA